MRITTYSEKTAGEIIPQLISQHLWRGCNRYYSSCGLELFNNYVKGAREGRLPNIMTKLVVAFENDKPIAWACKVKINGSDNASAKGKLREIWRYVKIPYRRRGLSAKLSMRINKDWKRFIPHNHDY